MLRSLSAAADCTETSNVAALNRIVPFSSSAMLPIDAGGQRDFSCQMWEEGTGGNDLGNVWDPWGCLMPGCHLACNTFPEPFPRLKD